MNKKEALVNSIRHVLRLVGEKEAAEEADWSRVISPVQTNTDPNTSPPRFRYTQLECLAASLYHQLTFLHEQAHLTCYTLRLDALFEVKHHGITLAFVYGTADPFHVSEDIVDSLASFDPETGIATRYLPLLSDPAWMELVDPSLLLDASQRLPIRFHYKTVYYSIARMVEIFFGREHSLIAGTKLGQFLKLAKAPYLPHRLLLL